VGCAGRDRGRGRTDGARKYGRETRETTRTSRDNPSGGAWTKTEIVYRVIVGQNGLQGFGLWRTKSSKSLNRVWCSTDVQSAVNGGFRRISLDRKDPDLDMNILSIDDNFIFYHYFI
jgi:hypothetical protein